MVHRYAVFNRTLERGPSAGDFQKAIELNFHRKRDFKSSNDIILYYTARPADFVERQIASR